MSFSKNPARILRSLLIGLGALALTACFVDPGEEPALGTESAALINTGDGPAPGTGSTTPGAACVFGDGFILRSGGHVTLYPVHCGTDCNDAPNGGLDTTYFCKNGVLGESDPVLSGGTLEPLAVASQLNGKARCTALATDTYTVSADRRICIHR